MVYVLPCANIGTPISRGQYYVHWRARFDEMTDFVTTHGQLAVSDDDNADYRRMARFHADVANILKLVQDTLRPRSFGDFIAHALEDLPRRA
jgi:hypothetical protein